MNEPTFKTGDLVKVKRREGTPLSPNKTYKVLHYSPEERATNFTFPAYVTVEHEWENGSKSTHTFHADRFEHTKPD